MGLTMSQPWNLPPIGVYPIRIWRTKQQAYPPHARDGIRAQMLLDAVFRYRAAGFKPSPQWSWEWREILVRGLTR
jgi:hypothetical protein